MEEVKKDYIKNEDGSWMTLDQIVADVWKKTSERQEDVDYLKTLKKREDMYLFHHTMGMYIRNTYGLWLAEHPAVADWFRRSEAGLIELVDGADNSSDHPDQISMTVLFKIWEKAHEA